MALNGFAPSTFEYIVGSGTVAASGTNALVTNLGNVPAYVAFGATIPTPSSGVPVLPGQQLVLTVGDNTQLSGTGNLSLVFGA
jgi:hypothetical protein